MRGLLVLLPILTQAWTSKLEWNELAGQFFLEGFFPDSALQPYESLEPNVQNVMSNLDGTGWALHQFRADLKSYTVRVEKIHGEMRLGLTTNGVPAGRNYREWMATSYGSWWSAGRCNDEGEEDEELWGSEGNDGWSPGGVIEMTLDNDKLMFHSEGVELKFSLDGFAPVLFTSQGAKMSTESVFFNKILTINDIKFDFETANFGPPLPDSKFLTGDVVFASPTDGCTPLNTRADGKVVFVDRGGCDFLDKVLHCQKAGALMVLIGQHKLPEMKEKRNGKIILPEDIVYIMEHVDRHEDAKRVKIPSVFVSFQSRSIIVKESQPMTVKARSVISKPAHCGLHWKEAGLTPGLWISPGGEFKVTVLPVVDRSPTSCRPLVYNPLNLAERQQWLYSMTGVHTSRTSSKRLMISAVVCNETSPRPFSLMSLGRVPRFPWDDLKIDSTPQHGWVIANGPIINWEPLRNSSNSFCVTQGARATLQGSVYSLEVDALEVDAQATHQIALCLFINDIVNPMNALAPPSFAQLGTGYRSKMRYFWQLRNAHLHSLSSVGVVSIPNLSLWGIRSDGILVIAGKNIELPVQMKSRVFIRDTGILLDLVSSRLYLFVDAHNWVQMDIDQTDFDILPMFEPFSKSDSKVVPFSPYVLVESGSRLEISFSPDKANEVYKRILTETKECIDVGSALLCQAISNT